MISMISIVLAPVLYRRAIPMPDGNFDRCWFIVAAILHEEDAVWNRSHRNYGFRSTDADQDLNGEVIQFLRIG